MRKFKVSASLILTYSINKEIKAETLQQATKLVLASTKEKDWLLKSEFKTDSK
jgi:hypothetical protein